MRSGRGQRGLALVCIEALGGAAIIVAAGAGLDGAATANRLTATARARRSRYPDAGSELVTGASSNRFQR